MHFSVARAVVLANTVKEFQILSGNDYFYQKMEIIDSLPTFSFTFGHSMCYQR